jgi:hypothetical protein
MKTILSSRRRHYLASISIFLLVVLVATGVGIWPGGTCDVGNWTDIINITAGGAHTVGVKSEGNVVAVGDNSSGQCDVGGWDLIV